MRNETPSRSLQIFMLFFFFAEQETFFSWSPIMMAGGEDDGSWTPLGWPRTHNYVMHEPSWSLNGTHMTILWRDMRPLSLALIIKKIRGKHGLAYISYDLY